MKILAIQFRYLGDAVLMTPALRAIKEHFPKDELHVLVAAEIAPLLQPVPWLKRVWAFPRARGKARLRESWPVIRALRRERFDGSVDFGSSDRSAIISLLCGARQRLAPLWPGGFLGRRFCYTRTVRIPESLHEVLRHLYLLSAWGIANPGSLDLEIHTDPADDAAAALRFPSPAVLCHLASGAIKKEWPLIRWAEFHRLAAAAGCETVFSTGISARDREQLEEFQKLAPGAMVFPPEPDLARFMAVIKRARLFVSGDTGPLHIAAGLGVPTVSLFGPSPAHQWAPLGKQHRMLQGSPCTCAPRLGICESPTPCMATISPEAVLQSVQQALSSIR